MEATVETAQFNTRMERPLKQAGDAVLKRAGYTPSQAVRALWRKAANYADNPQAVVELLEEAPRTTRLSAIAGSEERLAALNRGRESSLRALDEMGFDGDSFPSFDSDSYDALMEEFVLERYGE